MKVPRRTFLHLAAGAAALPAASRFAWAQTYPTRPVRLIVGVPAGGPPDILARIMGQWLSERLGQPFVIENRPGAGTNIATEAVVRAPADGYTLLQVTSSNAQNTSLYNKLNFNFIHDIAPVASIYRSTGVMEVNPTFPAKTVPEFIAYAKANPGKINMASSGTGTWTHVSGELFKMMAGVDMIHVPYRGTPSALTALFAGQVQVMFDILATSIEHIRVGKLRALAVTTATRSEFLPDIPTMAEFVPKCYRPNDSRACAVKQHSGAPLSAKGFFGHCQTPLGLDQRRALLPDAPAAGNPSAHADRAPAARRKLPLTTMTSEASTLRLWNRGRRLSGY